jgi:hypothetical protein
MAGLPGWRRAGPERESGMGLEPLALLPGVPSADLRVIPERGPQQI